VSGVDRAGFRRAASQFATGITVVSARLDGTDHAMTVTAFTSVSLDPVLVLFCAEKIARFHDAVLASGSWAVSFPHHPGPLTGAPVLDGALAVLECRTWAVHDGGDHSIVVGEVLGVSEPSPDGEPLLYYGSRYHRLSGG
jgi:flavin reductase (DIM6/NTAB) family NADH-FMN oxidoreductase RutF